MIQLEMFPALRIRTESELVSLALRLGAKSVLGWSPIEERFVRQLPRISNEVVEETRQGILQGRDPLGESFCALRSPEERRNYGATFTPHEIVATMVDAAARQGTPDRVVDPGVGSGRFLVAAGSRFPKAMLVGVELDPLPAMLARANLAVLGFANRSRIELADYRSFDLSYSSGKTLYVGNPPYVRHHQIDPEWKRWLVEEARKLNLSASQLAGLHVHFYLATAAKSRNGDFGIFITAAEWLDVNYGKVVRDLFLGRLGGKRIVVIEPTARPFPDAATTAAITQFEIGSVSRTFKLKRVETIPELRELNGNRIVRRERLESELRWSHMTRIPQQAKDGFVELGELCRVHRGQVTGANRVWVTQSTNNTLPSSVLFRTVTKARELITAGSVLEDVSHLRFVIDIPIELDILEGNERRVVDRFLAKAKLLGVDKGYVASNRRAWWAVGLKEPAPILATYMARRPPAFVLNRGGARHINIAHGLYPRENMSDGMMQQLASYLAHAVKVTDGRTYAGGLTKFEPREMERLIVPGPELLRHDNDCSSRMDFRAVRK